MNKAEIEQFIQQNIDSLDMLDVLCLIRLHPERQWSAEAVSKELRTSPLSAARRLMDLRALGLAIQEKSMFRYEPQIIERETLLDEVMRYYRERRVRVMELIYGRRRDKIRDFSDAFRILRDEEDG